MSTANRYRQEAETLRTLASSLDALAAQVEEPSGVDHLARQIWALVAHHEEADEALDFDEDDWRTLLIESEREEYRELARQAIAAAKASR